MGRRVQPKQRKQKRKHVPAVRPGLAVTFGDLVTNFGPLTQAFPKWRHHNGGER